MARSSLPQLLAAATLGGVLLASPPALSQVRPSLPQSYSADALLENRLAPPEQSQKHNTLHGRRWVGLTLRLGYGFGHTAIRNIPEPVRHVQQYSHEIRCGERLLSDRTRGWAFQVLYGAGLVLDDTVELSYERVYQSNGGGGRATWSELANCSGEDDYVGYVYRAQHSTARLSAPVFRNLFVSAGHRWHSDELRSGADAYSDFRPQRQTHLANSSYVIGLQYRGELTDLYGSGKKDGDAFIIAVDFSETYTGPTKFKAVYATFSANLRVF